MSSLDTISFKGYLDLLGVPYPDSRKDFSRFSPLQGRAERTGQVWTTWSLKGQELPTGVSQVRFDDGRQLHVELSAKALLEKYSEGITVNTVERLLDTLRTIPELSTLTLDGLVGVILKRVDATLNFHPSFGSQRTLMELARASANSKIARETWAGATGKLETVTWQKTTMKNTERLTFYDKAVELSRPKNRPFVEEAGLRLDELQGVVRCELRHASHGSIRKSFSLPKGEPTLGAVLLSETRPQLEVFNRVTQGQLSFPSFEKWGVSDLLDYFGAHGYFQRYCNGDRNLLIADVRMRSEGKTRQAVYQRVRKIITDSLKGEALTREDNETHAKIINEVRSFLAVA